MNTFTVWRTETPEGAEQLLAAISALVEQGQIRIDDATIVKWPHGRNKPTIRELGSIDGPGLLWSGFWGMLFGLIFLIPVGGLAFGATAGALAGSMSDFGVDDRFIAGVRHAITPGSSAIVALSAPDVIDRILAAAGDGDVELVRSDLNAEQQRRLRRALVDEQLVVDEP